MVSPVAVSDTKKKEKRENRRREKSTVLTSTPSKTALEEKIKNKSKVASIKKRIVLDSDLSKKGKIAKKTLIKKGKIKTNQYESSSESEEENDCLCIVCNSSYKDSRQGEG
jgi:hypothetical protein